MFKIKNNNYYLYDADISEDENYIVLESIFQQSKQGFLKTVHIIHWSNNTILDTISIGRSKDCNIILEDSSISKIHAYLAINDNNIHIYDNNSKFGTLFFKENVEMNSNFDYQIGRTFLNIL